MYKSEDLKVLLEIFENGDGIRASHSTSRVIFSSFIKIIVFFQKLSIFRFFCLSELLYILIRSLSHFVKSAVKSVLFKISFTIYLIDVPLEARYRVHPSFKEMLIFFCKTEKKKFKICKWALIHRVDHIFSDERSIAYSSLRRLTDINDYNLIFPFKDW